MSGMPVIGRITTIVASAVLVLGLATAIASEPSGADPAPGAFSTSFEPADPAALSSTVEVGADGTPVQHGIVGTSPHLPGSVIDSGTAITASAENPPGEIAKNLADGDPGTKWLAFQTSATLTYHLSTRATVVTYALTSAGDAPERDPAAWTLQGSTDGTTFTTIDTRQAQTWTDRGVRNTYQVADPGDYSYYRLDISAPQSGGLLQLADWDLAVATSGTSDQPMVTATGNGPTSGYNLKENAGFTGLHAYRYAGKQTTSGDAYETNVIQQGLDVTVGPRTRLSYKILPQSTANDQSYPATYATVDLHFTDGTYLSQLNPVDQHGVALTPAGQGDGKILYVDQWNAESSDIGDFADGKTIVAF